MADQTETHFKIMLALMMVFFLSAVALETSAGMHWVNNTQTLSIAVESFKACFYVAIGMFRGMLPQQKT